MIRIKVPATTANFGSGFDCLGAALNMYNIIDMEECEGCHITSTDSISVPTDESNLIYTSAASLFAEAGRKFTGLKIVQTNNIPLARGLGSSSACIAGGLIGANELLNRPFSLDELVNFAAVLEGHPDNSTPALLGGFVTAVMEKEKVHYVKTQVSEDLLFAAVIPDFELKTATARQAIPREIQHSDAVYNLSRSALLAVSMATGHWENIALGVQDKLHQPYRLPLINGAVGFLEHCDKINALGSYISGAGSTLMAVGRQEQREAWQKNISEYLQVNGFTGWRTELLSADNRGATVERI